MERIERRVVSPAHNGGPQKAASKKGAGASMMAFVGRMFSQGANALTELYLRFFGSRQARLRHTIKHVGNRLNMISSDLESRAKVFGQACRDIATVRAVCRNFDSVLEKESGIVGRVIGKRRQMLVNIMNLEKELKVCSEQLVELEQKQSRYENELAGLGDSFEDQAKNAQAKFAALEQHEKGLVKRYAADTSTLMDWKQQQARYADRINALKASIGKLHAEISNAQDAVNRSSVKQSRVVFKIKHTEAELSKGLKKKIAALQKNDQELKHTEEVLQEINSKVDRLNADVDKQAELIDLAKKETLELGKIVSFAKARIREHDVAETDDRTIVKRKISALRQRIDNEKSALVAHTAKKEEDSSLNKIATARALKSKAKYILDVAGFRSQQLSYEMKGLIDEKSRIAKHLASLRSELSDER